MQIFCVEQNYFLNKKQQIDGTRSEPLIFTKPPGALLPKGDPFFYPAFAKELYCGCELVLRISKNGRNIDEDIAANFYDSITVGINFIAFDNNPELSEEKLFWKRTKAWNNSSVTGSGCLQAISVINKILIYVCITIPVWFSFVIPV